MKKRSVWTRSNKACRVKSVIESEVHNMSRKRKYSNSEKAFYILSLLIVASMVIGLFAVALNPG